MIGDDGNCTITQRRRVTSETIFNMLCFEQKQRETAKEQRAVSLLVRRSSARKSRISEANERSLAVNFLPKQRKQREALSEDLTRQARAGHTGSLWPSGTEGRAQRGGVSERRTVGPRWRSRPTGVSLSIDQRSMSACGISFGTSFRAVSGTSPRPTSQRPVCASEMRTSQLPPSRARRANATIAPNAIR